MKRILILYSFLCGVVALYAQETDTENYIQTRIYLEPVTTSSSTARQIKTVEYIDGLGKPKQTVFVKASPEGNDVVKHYKYDDFGRQIYDYLPVPQSGTGNGAIVDNPLNNATHPEIYGNEKIFSEKLLEKSPLDRIFEQRQPGNQWSAKPVIFEYAANIDGEVKKYTASFNYSNFTSLININGTYSANQLTKNTVKDEDNSTTIRYTNGQGQLIMVRKVLSASQNADTYYVYNDYDQLAYVIPPLASVPNVVDDQLLNHLCYQYKYDRQNRLVEKKLPGKDWEFIVYDKQDRVILKQDAMLGTTTNNFNKKGWLLTKYDKFGRVVYTGFFATDASRSTLQNEVDNMSSNAVTNETRSTTPFTQNSIDIYYTNNAFPTGNITVLSVNHYDKYPPLPSIFTFPTNFFSQTVLTDDEVQMYTTNDLVVATYIKNVEDDTWTKEFFWYDQKGRLIGEYSLNHLGGYTKSETRLDFVGTIKETLTRHKRLITDEEKVILETFDHDDQNRLKIHKHQIGNNPVEYLVQNEYNELSQVKNSKVGGGNYGSGLQNIDYQYNIRGWLTKVNDPANLSGKLFGYSVKYDSPIYNNVAVGRFNGNISEVDWKSSTDGVLKRYNYVYDNLNRLEKGEYSEPESSITQNHYFDELLTYDLNGNIKTLQRFSKPSSGIIPEEIDDLIYNYENNNLSNKLSQITLPPNKLNNTSGYNALQSIYEYDVNGNITNNMDKRIGSMTYNYMNLATSIIQDMGHVTSNYVYQSNGSKIRKIEEFPLILRYKKITDYLDEFQYETIGTGPNFNTVATLKFLHTSVGYYDFEKNSYIYQYKDHLGNVRLTYKGNNQNGIDIVEAKNFYPFGLHHEKYFYDMYGDFLPNYAYAYNGKEYQALTGMYDFGARMYMPDIGRFGTQDPMQVFDMWQSSYSYANNNPILYQDEYGLGILNVIGNLFGRAARAIGSIFNSGCDCSGNSESIGDSFRRPDFPSNGGSSRGRSNVSFATAQTNNSLRSIKPVDFSSAGIIVPDISSNIPNLNLAGIPVPNVGINKIRQSRSSTPLPTNVEFNRNVEFNQNSTSLYDMALTEKTLSDLINTLQEHAELKLVISGNSTYNQSDNYGVIVNGSNGTVGSLKLGRARAIRKLLIKKGIDPNRILIKKGREKDYSTTFELKD